MATVVQLELMVDEKGAIQGVRQFGGAVGQVSAPVKKLDQELAQLGARATGTGGMMKRSMEQSGAAALSTKEKLHLVTEELGIHMPRAFRSVIAESRTAQMALEGLSTAMIGLAGIQIGFMVGEAAYNGVKKLWNGYLSLTSAARAYEEQLAKTREEKFADTQSIEDTKLRIDLVTESLRDYQRQVREIQQQAGSPSPLWQTVAPLLGMERGLVEQHRAHQSLDQQYAAQEQLDRLNASKAAQEHEEALQKIEYNHALDAELKGQQKINAELAKRKEINAENRAYEVAREKAIGNPVDAMSGAAKESIANRIAERQAQAESFNEAQEAAERESELEKRAREERDHSIDAYDRGIQRMMKADDEDELHYKEAQKQKMRAAQEFADRVDRMIEESSMRSLQGFARIRAEAQRQIEDLRKEAAEKDLKPEVLARGVAGITAGEQEQSAELARRNAEETTQIEDEARAHFLTAEKQQTLAIQQELRARLAKYQEELDQQEISQDDFNRRVVAAQQLAEAQMVEASRQAREKMAGEFTSFFKDLDHPLRALAGLGDKVAGQAAAAMVQRLQGRFGKSGSPMAGIYDKIAGVPHPDERGVETGARGGAMHSAMSVASAQIVVSSGTIVLGGGGGFAGGARAMSSGISGLSTMIPGALSGGSSTADMSSGISFGGSTSGPGFGPGITSGFAGPVGGGGGAITRNLGQGISFGKQLSRLFGKKSGAAAEPELSDTSGTVSAGLGGLGSGGNSATAANGGVGANAMGAAGGAVGLWSAYMGNGGVGGAASGAMSGMEFGASVGAMFGGPAGALIGGAIGAVGGAALGVFGFGGREKARMYDLRQVRPHIAQDYQAFEAGGMDYLAGYSDLETLDRDAEKTTKQYGPEGHAYYNDTIRKEIMQARGRLDQMERAGRSNFTATTAQYDSGTDYVPRTGMAVLHRGEGVLTDDRNSRQERATRALESMATPEAVRAGYQATMRRSAPRSASNGPVTNIHLNALDAKTGVQWLMDQRHVIRAANNRSYSENSGGADAGY
jgi:hypothetical protein